MLGLLEGIEEYNNQGALLGLEGIDDGELLGALRKMNPINRLKMVSKLSNTGAASKGSRAEMERFFGELPVNIKEALVKGELRLADSIIYSTARHFNAILGTQDVDLAGLEGVKYIAKK